MPLPLSPFLISQCFCVSQRVHLALSLRSAMSAFFKLKNYATCATFCRRILELNPDEKVSVLRSNVRLRGACPGECVRLRWWWRRRQWRVWGKQGGRRFGGGGVVKVVFCQRHGWIEAKERV